MYEDFKTILLAIEKNADLSALKNLVIENQAAKNFNLDINNEEEAEKLFKITNQQFDIWISPINDLEPHMQYAEKLQNFKNNFKPWIEIHGHIMKKNLMEASDVIKIEKKHLNIDITKI